MDGAHNEQKMDTFINNLSLIYPKQKFTFLIAFKKGKDHKSMLKKIIPLADKIFLTNFSTKNADNHWSSIDTSLLAEFIKAKRFNKLEIIPNKKSEILKAISSSKKPVVITGSLYLIGSIYSFLKK
jgi:dihydrofolate synthase/folylpolyglutamate synthase